jgi:O-antigen ligase
LFLYFNIYYILNIFYFKKKLVLIKFITIYLILFLIIYLSPLYDFLYDIVYLKLFSENIDISPMAYSKFDRLYDMEKGLQLFKSNFLFGIGSYNFGYYFPLITDSNIFADGTSYKKIINNIYIQILTENGIFTFFSFISIFLIIIKKFIKKRFKDKLDIIAFSFLISILIKWNAYPTYLLMFDWISLCFIIYIIWRKNVFYKC